MKKIAIAIILFCTLYSAYSLDYRQVIFGNSYKNIIEINADAFYEQYFPKHIRTESGERTTRLYKQIIGENTFYRAVLSNEKLTEADFLDWKNLEFVQVLYLKKSNTHLLQLGNSSSFKHIDTRGNPEYNGLEIIERNKKVIGIMKYTLSESDSYNNRASYTLWQNILNAEFETEIPTISYASFDDTEHIAITASNSLVDSKRPFMYTIQNAFDGNPATSYVENTDDDMFYFQIKPLGYSTFAELPECTSYMIINGYASGDYYYQNNQVAKATVSIGFSWGESAPSAQATFQLEDTLKPQVMSFEVIEGADIFRMDVEELTNGTLYNDTAIAEFDIYLEGEGWLFGSSDTDTIVASPTKANDYKYAIKDGNAEIERYDGEYTELTIPSIIEYRGKTYTVTSIGDSVFSGSRLISITISDSITSIGDSAFADCNRLTYINIPSSVTSIGDWAFSGSGLTSITIPDSITSIGDSTFLECYNLASITIPDSVTSIGDATFLYCYNLASITIPDSVTSIGDWAFSGSGLTSITIPNSVTSIGEGAFSDCENLTVSVYQDSYALEYAKENNFPYILIN